VSDTTERVIQVIHGVLKLTDAELQNLRTLAGYKQLRKWTSARHAEIMVALEDEFGLEIEERAIARLNDVAKIVAYIEGRRT
jgi:acyl carrier protein